LVIRNSIFAEKVYFFANRQASQAFIQKINKNIMLDLTRARLSSLLKNLTELFKRQLSNSPHFNGNLLQKWQLQNPLWHTRVNDLSIYN
jgi:hypothetical protein